MNLRDNLSQRASHAGLPSEAGTSGAFQRCSPSGLDHRHATRWLSGQHTHEGSGKSPVPTRQDRQPRAIGWVAKKPARLSMFAFCRSSSKSGWQQREAWLRRVSRRHAEHSPLFAPQALLHRRMGSGELSPSFRSPCRRSADFTSPRSRLEYVPLSYRWSAPPSSTVRIACAIRPHHQARRYTSPSASKVRCTGRTGSHRRQDAALASSARRLFEHL